MRGFCSKLRKNGTFFFNTTFDIYFFVKNLKMAIITLFSNKIGLLRVLLHNKLLKFVM